MSMTEPCPYCGERIEMPGWEPDLGLLWHGSSCPQRPKPKTGTIIRVGKLSIDWTLY